VAAQDQLLAEAARVLRPGAVLAGSDSTSSLLFRAAHLGDTMVLVDPEQFGPRLERAGFTGVDISVGPGAFWFRATRR
jgi:hypothetical protein